MWDKNKMPDPMGGKRLLDYDCKVTYGKDKIIKPCKIRTPDDIRPGTKKGKLDTLPIWVVEIMMPKKLIADIYGGYRAMNDYSVDPAVAPVYQQNNKPSKQEQKQQQMQCPSGDIVMGLQRNDLKDLLDTIVEIDSYKSKMGEDADIVTVAFSCVRRRTRKRLRKLC